MGGGGRRVGGKAHGAGRKIESSMVQPFSVDWDGICELWSDLFENEMKVDPAAHTFVATTLPDMTASSRTKQYELLFETFDAAGALLEDPAVLSLYASGMTNGLVVDLGNRLSITPISHGYSISTAQYKSFCGGLSLSEHLGRLLMDHGVDTSFVGGDGTAKASLLRGLKEQHCGVLPLGATPRTSGSVSHVCSVDSLGGAHTLEVPLRPLDAAAEMLFSSIGGKGLHEHIVESIHKVQRDDLS